MYDENNGITDLRDGPNAMEIDTQKVIPSTSEIANETMDISTSDAEQSFVCPDKSKTNSIIPQKKRTAKAVDLPQTSSKVQKTSTSESLDEDKFETRKEILVRDSIQDNVSVSRKKLLVLDLNGLLANIIDFKEASDQGLKGTTLKCRKTMIRRPFCKDFLRFCFEKFQVGIWSSRKK